MRFWTLHHHGSHRGLLAHLATPDGTGAEKPDAIIVPAARAADSLKQAVLLASELDCTLLVLCSRRAAAKEAARLYGDQGRFRLVAVDVPAGYRHHCLQFATSEIAEARNGRATDTSLKRNLALLIARQVGWRRVFFLDDDVEVPDPIDLRRATALLDRYPVVGLELGGYPDNSVVCLLHRFAGGGQDSFVGGGALAVDLHGVSSFFPDTYNEDWFFLLDGEGLHPVARTGLAVQATYNPFRDPLRAWNQEFGDVMAEGIFALLDNGRPVSGANWAYWRRFLFQRRSFIKDVCTRTVGLPLDPRERQRRLDSLRAAQKRNAQISARQCADYVRLWQRDRAAWQSVLADMPRGRSVEEALRWLNLSSRRNKGGGQPVATRAASRATSSVLGAEASSSVHISSSPSAPSRAASAASAAMLSSIASPGRSISPSV